MNGNERLIDKVRKLYALAEGTTNPHEAAAAMARAEAIRTAHNLAEAEIEMPPVESIGETDVLHDFHVVPAWFLYIADAAARNAGGFCYLSRSKGGLPRGLCKSPRVIFVGSPQTIEVATYTLDFLKVATERHVAEALLTAPQHVNRRAFASAARTGFASGVCAAVKSRVEAEKRARAVVATPDKSTALALRNDRAIDVYRANMGEFGQHKSRAAALSSSFQAGIRQSINAGLTGAAEKPTLRLTA